MKGDACYAKRSQRYLQKPTLHDTMEEKYMASVEVRVAQEWAHLFSPPLPATRARGSSPALSTPIAVTPDAQSKALAEIYFAPQSMCTRLILEFELW